MRLQVGVGHGTGGRGGLSSRGGRGSTCGRATGTGRGRGRGRGESIATLPTPEDDAFFEAMLADLHQV